jgi:hypothetical protein
MENLDIFGVNENSFSMVIFFLRTRQVLVWSIMWSSFD